MVRSGAVSLHQLDLFNGADESVTDSADRLNEDRVARVVTQYFANIGQALLESVIGYGSGGPDLIDQFIFSHQAVAMFQQVHKHLETLLSDVLFLPVAFKAHT
jgi:hypothetical protein